MAKFIQIEELVYGRLPHVSKADWINMLTEQRVHSDYTVLMDDYLLLEQSDYRFANGQMISSERVVYNIDFVTYGIAKNAPEPEDTEEVVVVHYDTDTDRFFVRYVHYPASEAYTAPDLSYILSEADIPSTKPAIQAPAETRTEKPVVQHHIQPTQKPAKKPTYIPAVSSTEYHKPWRQKRLTRLKELYNKGYSIQQILMEFEGCTEAGVKYQLKTYLGIEHPFSRQDSRRITRPQWSMQEVNQLITLYSSNKQVSTIAHKLNRDIDDVMDKMRRLKLID